LRLELPTESTSAFQLVFAQEGKSVTLFWHHMCTENRGSTLGALAFFCFALCGCIVFAAILTLRAESGSGGGDDGPDPDDNYQAAKD
jgi:hypothetical protein